MQKPAENERRLPQGKRHRDVLRHPEHCGDLQKERNTGIRYDQKDL